MSEQLFRKVALERLASLEQLDRMMRVTTPKGWVALIALGSLIVAAIVWGILGSIPEKVAGQGILMKSGGIINISAMSVGKLTAINVAAGDHVVAGQIVARIAQPSLLEQIRQTKAQLVRQESNHRAVVEFGSKDIQIQIENFARQSEILQGIKRDLGKQLGWLQKRAKNESQLLEKGSITRQTLETILQSINLTLEQVTENNNNLKQVEALELELKNHGKQELISSQQEVDNTRENLAMLRYQMEVDSRVLSPFTGRIVEVLQVHGASVQPATPICSLEPTGLEVSDLEALIFVPPADGKKVFRGMEVQILPTTVKQEEYGFLRGVVTMVGEYPASTQAMLSTLENQDLVKMLSNGGAPIEIRAELLPDPDTVSGFRWSSAKGPSVKIHSGTLCLASIITRERRPVSLVIPLLNKYLLGVGQERPQRTRNHGQTTLQMGE